MDEPSPPDGRRWRHSPAWLVGYPTLVGAATGAAGALFWEAARAGCATANGSMDCVVVPALQFVFGVPVALAAIWILLAVAEYRLWVPPTVMLGGLTAAGYAVGLIEHFFPSGPPSIWLIATVVGAAFGVVATACLPRPHWMFRVVAVATLVAPALVGRILGVS